MAKISGISARNLRTLYDLGDPIRIAPITVLLGRNSAGKSTFARILPLLRQSAERRKRSPILWFDDLVDFGTFSQAVTRGEDTIELTLQIDNIDSHTNAHNSEFYFDSQHPTNPISLRTTKVSLTLRMKDETTYASTIKIETAGTNIRLEMSSPTDLDSIWVGEKEYTLPAERHRVVLEQGAILPKVRFIEKKRIDSKDSSIWFYVKNPWQTEIVDFILSKLHKRTHRETVKQIVAQLSIGSLTETLDIMSKIEGPNSWQEIRGDINFSRGVIDKLIISNIDILIEKIDEAISSVAKGVRYIKPIRATAERYYRRADLAVSEIDPDGRNLPIFLDSLSSFQLRKFREWLKENLGLDVIPKKEGAQIALQAKSESDSDLSNVADMGFGISQILPVAAQLWASINQFSRHYANSSFIVIEQPELHLHPEFQAKIGNVLAGVISRTPTNSRIITNSGPNIIVETHSQHLVNRLGLLIEEKKLAPEDVSIVIFEPNTERPGTSSISVAKFDSNGVLDNWPYGFFEPTI